MFATADFGANEVIEYGVCTLNVIDCSTETITLDSETTEYSNRDYFAGDISASYTHPTA